MLVAAREATVTVTATDSTDRQQEQVQRVQRQARQQDRRQIQQQQQKRRRPPFGSDPTGGRGRGTRGQTVRVVHRNSGTTSSTGPHNNDNYEGNNRIRIRNRNRNRNRRELGFVWKPNDEGSVNVNVNGNDKRKRASFGQSIPNHANKRHIDDDRFVPRKENNTKQQTLHYQQQQLQQYQQHQQIQHVVGVVTPSILPTQAPEDD